MRRFYLQRDVDESGISGAGRVADGVQFSIGLCVLVWLTGLRSFGCYENIQDLEEIHGHEGKTRVVWIDP
jgi:hypothetical protein